MNPTMVHWTNNMWWWTVSENQEEDGRILRK